MRKILFVFVSVFVAVAAHSQVPVEIDEELLYGEWGSNGTYAEWRRNLLLTGFNFGQFGTTSMYLYDVSTAKQAELQYADYSVTNNNKLHLISPSRDSAVRFVIMSLYRNEDDGMLHVIMRNFGEGEHHTFHLIKKDSEMSVRSEESGHVEEGASYNLNGMKTDSKVGIYIQSGRKFLQQK